jgi:hypothetical protein
MENSSRTAPTTEMAKWVREADEFCRVVLEPNEQPFFISDEATVWDLVAGDPSLVMERTYAHYGVRLNVAQFKIPFWKLLGFLSDNRTRKTDENC